MIQRLTESFISGVELLETECRLAKRHAADFVVGAVAVVGLGVIAVVGMLGVLVGAALWLAPTIGIGPALVATGGVGFALSVWIARRMASRLREGESGS